MDIDNFIADVTRVCIVNHSGEGQFGRVLDVRNIVVDLMLQDDGRTLKVFINDFDGDRGEVS